MFNSPTIDQREVEYYRNMAQMWWDTSGPFWPLHELNKLRIDWIKQMLIDNGYCDENVDQPLKGLKVLDVGCGGGILSESLAQLGAVVHGVDVVEKNIHIARIHAHANKYNIEYTYSTVESLVNSNLEYDVLFNMEVVEHVADLETFLHACCKLVKPDGAMFVATINRTIIAFLTAIIGAEYIMKWLPRGTHRYSMLRKPREIIDPLINCSIQPKDMIGVGVNPFTRNFYLRKNLDINYMIFAQKD